jgi:hypothetical protein
MSIDLILIALGILAGVGYFAIRGGRKQAEFKQRRRW